MRRAVPPAAVCALGLVVAHPGAAQPPAPRTPPYPTAASGDAATTYFGVRVADPYLWMEDLAAPATRRWLAAEDALTAGWFAAADAERAALRARLSVLAAATPRARVPVRGAGRYFAPRDGGGDQPVLVARLTPGGPGAVVLDVNARPRTTPPERLVDDFLHVSPDGRYLAYGLAAGGSDWQRLHVRDLRTGADLPDRLEGLRTWMWAAWTADGAGFFYPRELPPAPGAPAGAKGADQLLYHRLGTPQSTDRVLVDLRADPARTVRPWVSADGRYLTLLFGRGNEPRRQLAVADLGDPRRPNVGAPPRLIVDSADALYAVAGNAGPVFYVATTAGAPRGRVVAVNLRDPRRARWRTVVPEGRGTLAVDPHAPAARLVGGRLVLATTEGLRQALRVYALDGRLERTLAVPEGARVGQLQGTPDGPELLYAVVRFPHPAAVWRADVATGAQRAVTSPHVSFDPDRYETHVAEATSADGARVPVYVTHRRGLRRDGSHPTYLLGYGGYGGTVGPAGYAPGHRLLNTAWLELGGVVAVASLRGDGTYGEAWHAAATGVHKQRTFDDGVAAAEYLVRAGYTSPARLAVGGTSNGGLLVAALVTQRPDLFAAALPDVPLTDMLRAARLPGGDIGAPEYGTPDTPEQFRALLAYSPLRRVRAGTCYPATLVTTGLNDENVHPSHALRFTAALQAAQACGRPVLLRAEADAGHGGGVGARAQVEKTADVLLFLARQLGVSVTVPAP